MSTPSWPLTKEEQKLAPTYFDDLRISLVDNNFYTTWNNHPPKSETARGPWILLDLNWTLESSDFYSVCTNYHRISNVSFHTLIGQYKDKDVHWHPTNWQWQYINHRPIIFTPTPKPSPTPLEQDEEEVASTLASVTQHIESLVSQVSHANTPSSPSPGPSHLVSHQLSPLQVPGSLPKSPRPSSIVPSPLGILPPVVPLSCAPTPFPPSEDTKIYAFKQNINNGIHQKLLGVSPTPTTLANLVSKACKFNHAYEIYQS